MRSIECVNAQYGGQFEGQYALVLGEGAMGSRLMLVGEAPGAQEALQGRPFVGRAGKNLDAFLRGVGLLREQIYITNAVKFRPTKPGAAGRLCNRTPTREETKAFRPWLLAEIAALRPRVVATLGNTALRAVRGRDLAVGDAHGAPLSCEEETGYRVFPLYHPASVIYRRELAQVCEKDILRLQEHLQTIRED